MATKRDLIYTALEELGIASYEFDPSGAELSSCLRRMDMMIQEWEGLGITLGYNIPTEFDGSDLDDESGLPQYAFMPVSTNLAVRVAPMWGKTPSRETKSAARIGYNTICTQTSAIPYPKRPDILPLGAGNVSGVNGDQFFPNVQTVDPNLEV